MKFTANIFSLIFCLKKSDRLKSSEPLLIGCRGPRRLLLAGANFEGLGANFGGVHLALLRRVAKLTLDRISVLQIITILTMVTTNLIFIN